MQFKPKSEDELMMEQVAISLIKPGIYPFEVIDANNKFSKAGNEMIELKIKVWDDEGRERTIFDYLLESMSYKLRHFCQTTGLLNKYEIGIIDEMDCIGKSGLVDIIVQKGTKKPDGNVYPDRNSVKDYLTKEGFNSPEKKQTNEIIDDDIPF